MRFRTAQDVADETKGEIRAVVEEILFGDGAVPMEDYTRLIPVIDSLIEEIAGKSIVMLHRYATPVPEVRDAVLDW